jgi:hypothetical protein
MTKRLMTIAIAFVLLGAGCGREGALTTELAGGVTPTPVATTTPAATPAATEAAATPTAAAGAAPSPGGDQTQTTKPASEGGVNTPKDGSYVYTYKGEQTGPTSPSPQRFDGERTVESSHEGNVYTSESTNTEQPGRFTTRTRWEPTRILLLAFKNENPAGDFNCTFDPPLVIAKIPIKAEKFPTQQLKGTGNFCDGKLDITFERQEPMKDATGRSWSTWRVRVQLQAGNQQVTTTSDETQWFSPELGAEIKTDGTTNGEAQTPGGPQKFSGKSTSVLKSHP